MPDAISNTSPLLYLYRIDVIDWLPEIFDTLWIPDIVAAELREGERRGYDVPDLINYQWGQIIDSRSAPSEWLALDLGAGELAAMALALEHPERVVLLDDALARRIAKAAGLTVWGALRILLEAKSKGLAETIAPLIDQLETAGMWLSADIRSRVLRLADEVDDL